MRKNGFTLIELLAVIIIISLTSLIIFPAIGKVIKSSKESLHQEQLLDIEEATEKWATDNMNLLDEYHLNIIYIDLKSIRNAGYLEKDEIKNPLTNEIMNGCIQVKYDLSKQKYNFVYEELACNSYASSSDINSESGYIIYSYNTKSKQYETSSDSVIHKPAGLKIYEYYLDKNLIKADGETGDGLYETEEEYVFRGENPNNYVTLQGIDSSGNTKNTSWRILGINKKDYSIRLIGTTVFATNVWNSSGKVLFSDSESDYSIGVKLADIDYGSSKIFTSEYKNSIITGEEMSVVSLNSTLQENKTSLKTGTISVFDYVNASATLECQKNYLSIECKNSNYLYQMFGTSNSTWTSNTNGSQVWYISTDGSLATENSGVSTKSIYPVITLNTNTYIDESKGNPTGTADFKYILK